MVQGGSRLVSRLLLLRFQLAGWLRCRVRTNDEFGKKLCRDNCIVQPHAGNAGPFPTRYLMYLPKVTCKTVTSRYPGILPYALYNTEVPNIHHSGENIKTNWLST
ncbi:hypothetical protein F4811DRAFT_334736 [Daldinia bambusicola]|nr:hypothetical protein F4811DRAFT_334736 [Daldinia bambusicola]